MNIRLALSKGLLLFAALSFSHAAFAADDISTMIITFSSQYGAMYKLITGMAYILGLGLVFKALYHLKVYGELRTMMRTETSLKQPLSYLGIGAIFLFLPTAMDIMMNSSFGYTSIMSYDSWYGAKVTGNSQGMIAVGGLVQLIGLSAFIRGWVLMSKAAGQGQNPNSASKALTHIVGGLCAINIYGFGNLVSNSLGISFGSG